MRKIQLDISAAVSVQDASSGLASPSEYADRIGLLLARADILNGKDRALVKMYLENGIPFSRIAQVSGVSEVAIARRIHKLMRRLAGGEYINCLRNRQSFSRLEQVIAKDRFLEGLSQQDIANKRQVSVYRVRKTLRKIRNLQLFKGRSK